MAALTPHEARLLLSRNWLIKRFLDYLLVLPLFLFSLPIVGLFALWIKKVSRGPAFYSQIREGYNGRTIRIWKLRTMLLLNPVTMETMAMTVATPTTIPASAPSS